MAGGIASSGILKNAKSLGLCFDNLLHSSGVLGTRLALCYLFLVLGAVSLLAFSRPWIRKEDRVHTRAALRALFTFIIPTCSLWSTRYIDLASVLRLHIDVPLEMIIKDTVDGVIELRNPISDLENLIGSGTTVNGYTIRVNLGWRWWMHCFEWWMLSKFDTECASELPDWLHEIPTTNPSLLDTTLSPFALTLTSCPLLCLDGLSKGFLPSLNAGSTATLEFTAFSSPLRLLSMEYVVSAIPFIMSSSRRRPRSLVSVVEQLGISYGPDVVIGSISNVSADYEHALQRVYKSLSEEQGIREAWVKNVNIKAWRLAMFLVALETALVRRGWIERWAVQVTVE